MGSSVIALNNSAVCAQAGVEQACPIRLISAVFLKLFWIPHPLFLTAESKYPLERIPRSFAQNSRSTSLQRVALRRVVSLSSCYFLQKHSPQKGNWG